MKESKGRGSGPYAGSCMDEEKGQVQSVVPFLSTLPIQTDMVGEDGTGAPSTPFLIS